MTGKVLVTGAGGFIGSTLVEELLDSGYSVRALVHYNGRGDWGLLSQLPAESLSRVEVVAGDVIDPGMMRTVVSGCDFVCHLAALIGIPYSYIAPASYVATNVNGTLNILEACREHRVRRVIVTSTSEVYGTAQYSPIDEAHPLQGQSPYSASKIAADKISESYYRCFDVPVVTLRPFNTFGPRQSSRAVIPTILTQALSGRERIELGSLDPKRDLTFVRDTALGFRLALEAQGIDGETIHFGSGETISIGELAKLCLQVTGSSAEIVCTSERVRPEKSEVGLLHCNPARANNLLGWSPTVTLKRGLELTADYLRSRLGDHRISTYSV